MLDRNVIDAVAIAVPPWAQREICDFALARGIHAFAEKPLASNLSDARAMAHAAALSSCANVVDFNFREITAFRAAEDMLRSRAIGGLRHVSVTWQVESYSNRARLSNWKADQEAGGGALFNFVSHSLNYLEGFAGEITGLSARLAGLPGDPRPNDSFVAMAFAFANGAAGSLVMSAAAFQGSGHRIDIHGEDGTIVLANDTSDYMRGFRLLLARRPGYLEEVGTLASEPDAWDDGRVLPVSRLARRFVNWAQGGTRVESDFAAGLRVQALLEAARLSHRTGAWIDVAPDCEFSIRTPPSGASPAPADKRI
jgi:predicted dehydrogenase